MITNFYWRDPKRYSWLLGLMCPAIVVSSWIGAQLTGFGLFWWLDAQLSSALSSESSSTPGSTWGAYRPLADPLPKLAILARSLRRERAGCGLAQIIEM